MIKRILCFSYVALCLSNIVSTRGEGTKTLNVFDAVVMEGSRLRHLRVNEQKKNHFVTIDRPLIIKARFASLHSNYILILDKKGIPKYSTHHRNIEDIERVTRIHPQIDNLAIYDKKASINVLEDGRESYFSHFFSLTNFQGKSDFQSSLLGGTETATSGLLGMTKNYFINKTMPAHLGFNLGFYRGSWKDDRVGSSTSQALFVGPSLMATFFAKKDSAIHTHLHFFQSLRHQMGSDPSPINLSTNGWQIDIEREFTWFDKPFFASFNYRLTNSKVTSSSQLLDGPVEKTPETSYGLSFGYRFNWSL